ncbi:hypothetical protein CEP54_014316 [Fusarium duplospermum]|uniref:Isochorismatase-like domain-containing protein n=1 Tax=Fusarium duplospermum TaxID=1325734 RepID=A0A428NWY0_9HYPO|nr:hypothetical protein CEP54_014316 [Fusarium duplospermum]
MASVTPAADAPSLCTVVGNPESNFWLFDKNDGWDLTHPSTPDGPTVHPRVQIQTTTAPVTIAPKKTALVIIDMQNLFLSSALWGKTRGEGHDAEDALLNDAIPAARKAGIQVMHVTWGISEQELDKIPPVLFRIFGFGEVNSAPPGPGKERGGQSGVGKDLGNVQLPDGSTVSAGRLLMRDQFNTALHDPLQQGFDKSQNDPLPHVRFHKNRLSGFWSGSTSCVKHLQEKGITTLLFAGVNTDQCVLASVQDASNIGFDTILLKDGCGTTSPDYTRKMVEFNCRKSWGFVSSCQALKDGVDNMTSSSLL